MRTASRTIKVLGALVAGITVVSGVLLALEPAPAFRPSNMSFSAFDSDAGLSGPEALLFDTAPSPAGGWKGIVIRDSRGIAGGQAELDDAYRRTLGQPSGAGYHFVVRKDGTGRIEVCERWRAQAAGAFASGAEASALIGVCLVGDADRTNFDQAQLDELAWLVGQLQTRYGISADRVHLQMGRIDRSGHSAGRHFPVAEFKAKLAKR